jgi:hypothetical protein
MDEMNPEVPDRRRLLELAQAATRSREALIQLVDESGRMNLRQDGLPVVELAACVPGLIELLGEVPLYPGSGPWTAWYRAHDVVQLLGDIGPAAAAAIPKLMFWMHHDPRGLGPCMAQALGRIGGDKEIRELNTWCDVDDRKLRDGYLDGLAAAGQRAHETLLRITRDLNEPEYARGCAIESLRVAGYADRDLAVRAVEMIADDPSEVVRKWAIEALERLARDYKGKLVLSVLEQFERTRPEYDHSDRAPFTGINVLNRLRTTLARLADNR